MSEVPTVIGRYDVERLLGEGGMGVLYLARDPVIDRHVALKLLRVNGEDLRRRLMREAQSAGRLQHPNVVTVYDVGDHDGQLYIAMEFIDGDTLATLIRDDVPFSSIRKLDIVDEIADGLGYAHQRGIIHRDIKPANLMISRGGLVKVLDFGIARVTHRESGEIDAPTLIGTPAYMAPEQLEGAEVDARSDIYAVGLVMYELFSGRRAFAGATTADVLQQVLASQPTPIDRLVPDIDPELAKVIARAMARQPADRYQDLQAMRKDLARARRRAMQGSADDATIVVGVPVTVPVRPAALPITVVPTLDADETIYAPVTPVSSPTASAPPPLPPLPARSPDALPASADDLIPVPLPAVPSSGVFPLPGAGRSTVDAPVIAAARDRGMLAGHADTALPRPAGSGNAPSPGDALAGAASSPPRMVAPAAPPPVASPGAVQSAAALGTAPIPAARRGVPAGLIVGALLAMLGVCFVVALVAVRSFGLLGGHPLSGVLTTTVEPKVTGPSIEVPPAATEVPVAPPSEVSTTASTEAPASEGAVASDSPTSPTRPAETPPPVAPPATPIAPPPTTPARVLPPPTRQVPTARATRTSRQAEQPSTRPEVPNARETPREVAPVVAEQPPQPAERREPEPPPVAAPDDEALVLVRGYVAARNTAHASGIRRVWPGVDDNHLRRVTSSFSAPLSLTGCDITARDVTHAVATCQLTQPGTTGAYAPGQGLTIRRTFVFDLVRQNRAWVIAGLRE